MPRPDLLALTPDDLATLANRGLVKRAQTELAGGELEYTLSENKSGTVSVLWSDDVHCLLPSNVPLQEAKCSCPATSLCRHLIRSVLAYQQEHAGETAEPETPTGTGSEAAETAPEAAPSPAQIAWNPAEIAEEDLEKVVPAATVARARREWDAGHVIETSCGPKPSAYFHSAGVNLRFLVPHDVRYTHCDCAEAPPCIHVPLAVWAFRESEKAVTAGLVSTRLLPLEVPKKLLDELEAALLTLASDGIANTAAPFLDLLTRLERECRQEGLMWPADIVAELREQIEFYRAHNARFESVKVAHLAGELLVRSDAIRSDTGAVPPLFVRGTAKERITEVGAARLVGLGTSARLYKGGAEMQAFLQDVDSGAVVVVRRDFPNPAADANQQLLRGVPTNNAPPEPAPLWKLAAQPVAKGVGLGALGSGQLLVRGGKRTPSGEFLLGRAPASFNLQAFEWDKLRAPLLAENFAALNARLQMLPPASLRPRRLGEDIHVVPLAGIEGAFFDRAEQAVKANLRDREGGTAILVHSYTVRGAEGWESLMQACLHKPADFRFVAARFERHAGQLVASPLALVLGDGRERHVIQPWVDRFPAGVSQSPTVAAVELAALSGQPDILRDFGAEVTQLAGETFQIGLQRSDVILARRWEECARRSHALGLNHVSQLVDQLEAELAQKARVRHWESAVAGAVLMEVVLNVVLLSELV